jgi:glutaredoxin 3
MPTPVTIYFTPGCGYCVRARGLLEQLRVPFEAINVARDQERRRWLVDVTGRRTVPQIFIGGRPIGGADDLFDLYETGELEHMLEPTAPGGH